MTQLSAAAPAHVEAFCCTGTSPGVTGHTTVSVDLQFGGHVDTRVGYEVHGPAYGPAVVVLGGISASRHLAPTAGDPSPGWWPGVVGAGLALDPTRQRLIGIDFLGGPQAAVPAGTRISSRDQAEVVRQVLSVLGVRRASFVGASYGGMVSLALAALDAKHVISLVLVAAAHRPHPMATAWRAIQRDIVRFGAEVGDERRGLSLGRALAMTTYRSEFEFAERFDFRPKVGGGARFPVEAYLTARGDAFAATFGTEAFVSLSESIDLHDVDPSQVTAPTSLVSFDTDRLVPTWLVEELAQALPGPVCHVRLGSPFGHDAFLKEPGPVSAAITDALAIRWSSSSDTPASAEVAR
jgi:homoserine O-acetyltransferase/O-succinyltransferase